MAFTQQKVVRIASARLSFLTVKLGLGSAKRSQGSPSEDSNLEIQSRFGTLSRNSVVSGLSRQDYRKYCY